MIAAGHLGEDAPGSSYLAAIRLQDGTDAWREKLPAAVVKGGLAVNQQGQILVTLENGQLLAFAAAK